jgi:hypothetical protein
MDSAPIRMTTFYHQSEHPQVSIVLQEVIDRLTILYSQQVASSCSTLGSSLLSKRKRVAEFNAYIAKYADFDHKLQYQLTQLDQNKDYSNKKCCHRANWDGAVFVGNRLCTLTLRRKRGLFEPANKAEYRRIRNDIPNIYCKGCVYGSIDILLGFSGSVFKYLWDHYSVAGSSIDVRRRRALGRRRR